jgi:hypothetical protein
MDQFGLVRRSSTLSEGERNFERQTEPTVWDWFLSVLRRQPIPIPEETELPVPEDLDYEYSIDHPPEFESTEAYVKHELSNLFETDSELTIRQRIRLILVSTLALKNLRLPVAVFCALIAQLTLETKPESLLLPILLYIWAFVAIFGAVVRGDFSFTLPLTKIKGGDDAGVRTQFLVLGAGFSLLAFQVSRANTFDARTLFFWIGAVIMMILAFWDGNLSLVAFQERLDWLKRSSFKVSNWNVLVVLTIGIVIFFRVHQLNEVPYEMWSDHAEKLLDVRDIFEGKTSIFFPRNTGREAIQFYLAAATAKLLGTGLSFITLKIGTVLIGLVTLPYVYLFAKEYGGRSVGLIAFFLTGIAYWPNVISRLGLRFPLYPLFVAPALYYLLRGFRLRERNDFIYAGVALGLGLHGYSPARTIPIVFSVGVLLYILHVARKDRLELRRTLTWWAMAAAIALVVFLPLLGVMSENPEAVIGRSLSRISSTERPLPGNPINLFITNIWNGLRMFAWDNGNIWVVSIPQRPALDWVTAAFFNLGIVIVMVRIFKKRRWQDSFLLLSIPFLLLPSILSLAFPGENPAPNRASGAMIPVFTLAAIPLSLIPGWIESSFEGMTIRKIAPFSLIALLAVAALNNYGLVFNTFADQHRRGTWNTSEVGDYIRGFATSIGSFETAHVIAYPHWLDTRLVAINAGIPGVDYGIWPDQIEQLEPTSEPQIFIFNQEDEIALSTLIEIYPDGESRRIQSFIPGRDFMVYSVPRDDNGSSE